ncbi:hypothetical protein INR49_014270 [Caranx melampygus]|nr:hypothetical protein INR49_014270 [Caranx melampygus]
MSDAIIGVIDKADTDNGLTKGHTEGTVSDLIGAGLDTVSTALHWLVLLLAKHPEIQTKLHELIDKVVGPERLPSVEDRSNLAYLDAFIYETMRFTSFVPVTIPHSTTSDVTVDGLNIPKNTVVFINQWSVNHDPLKWKDPHVFDPTRFLDENGSLDKDLTSGVMIFSAGKRRCIGDQIAKVEIFLFFAILLHQCSFEKCPSEDLLQDQSQTQEENYLKSNKELFDSNMRSSTFKSSSVFCCVRDSAVGSDDNEPLAPLLCNTDGNPSEMDIEGSLRRQYIQWTREGAGCRSGQNKRSRKTA